MWLSLKYDLFILINKSFYYEYYVDRGVYMLFNLCLIAICVSLDSLGIGLTYGLKNTKISLHAKLILFIISIIITSISIILGNFICKIFEPIFSKILGCLLLCFMGLWIIIQSITNNKEQTKKEYHFFIKFLGITIQIIRDPNYSDLNKSNKIEGKEALYLGTALSLDSIGIGIGSSIMGINSFLFPLLASTFQLFFLSIGSFLGKKIKNISNIPENIWSIISGCLLIFVGISKIVF